MGTSVVAPIDGFDAAFPGMHQAAYRIAFRLLGSREEAAEIAQEACARAFARWHRLVARGDVTPWVVRVSGNLALDVWRRRKTAERHVIDLTEAERDPSSADRIDLHRALTGLSHRQRQVVLLRYVADLSEETVADTLGCSAGTVKQHASRGLAALRSAMRSEED